MTALLTVVRLWLTTLSVALFLTGYIMKSRRILWYGRLAIVAGSAAAAVWWVIVGNWIAAILAAALCVLAARRIPAKR